jgi:predicted patatin/cPLA2 family phospholipase
MVQLMLGAGVQSAQGAGQLLALQDMGYTEHTHAFVGSSGASGPVLYAAEGNAGAACAVFAEDATTDEFLTQGGVPKLDTKVIARVMRSKGPKGVSVEGVKKAHAQVYALITNAETGIAELKDMKEMEDPIDVCEASSAIPMFREPVDIDGKPYIDGGFASVPLEEIIQKTNPTHLLIHPNEVFNFMQSYENSAAEKAGLTGLSPLGPFSKTAYTAEQLMRRKERMGEVLKKIGEDHGGIKIAVLWPPEEGMNALNNDPDIVRRGIYESYRKTISDFGEKQPERIDFFAKKEASISVQDLAEAA